MADSQDENRKRGRKLPMIAEGTWPGHTTGAGKRHSTQIDTSADAEREWDYEQ